MVQIAQREGFETILLDHGIQHATGLQWLSRFGQTKGNGQTFVGRNESPGIQRKDHKAIPLANSQIDRLLGICNQGITLIGETIELALNRLQLEARLGLGQEGIKCRLVSQLDTDHRQSADRIEGRINLVTQPQSFRFKVLVHDCRQVVGIETQHQSNTIRCLFAALGFGFHQVIDERLHLGWIRAHRETFTECRQISPGHRLQPTGKDQGICWHIIQTLGT